MDHAGGGTVHGLQSVKSGENDGLLLMALRDFFAINNLAMRDFGLLESGREDNKPWIPDFIFIMPGLGGRCQQWQL
jgi:hypothetical protein